MIILAHRGLWHFPEECNQPNALRRAIFRGFGIETDVRDLAGKLVIAHDPPSTITQPKSLESFLSLYLSCRSTLPLALNIKADGLRNSLKTLLNENEVRNYFCFDMSVPETIAYRRAGLKFFTRQSEFETTPVLYDDAAGVWMDMFYEDWIIPENILRHVDARKHVALVSPEIHRRPQEKFWNRMRDNGLAHYPGVMLCTDFPEAAREFFCE